MSDTNTLKLPIDIIVGTRPQKFKWRQRIDKRIIECEGVLPASVEGAVLELIAVAKYTTSVLADVRKDNEALQKLVVEMQEKVAKLEAQQIPQSSSKKEKK